MKKTVGLKEIARQAGVHEATVSAVLSESSRSGTRVSAETAERIRRIARELHYRPNRHAQIIRRRRSGIIGIVEFGVSEIAITRSLRLARHCSEEGVAFLAQNAKWFRDSAAQAFGPLLDARVEGIVLVMPNLYIPPALIAELGERGIPLVAYNGTPVEGYPHVRSDVVASMQELITHLAGLGRKRLALLSRWPAVDHNHPSAWMIKERLLGFERTIVQLGGALTPAAWRGKRGSLVGRIRMAERPPGNLDYYREGMLATREALSWSPRPDALLCSNDQFAVGARLECHRQGIRVPEEIAITGFGNLEITPYLDPPLTTIDTRPQPGEAETILRLLRQMIDGKPLGPEDHLIRLPSPLVVRESCGAGHA